MSFVNPSPWCTSERHPQKALGRRLERPCKRTGLEVHTQMYYEHLVALERAKPLFYANIISTRTLFSAVNKPHEAVPLSPIQCVSYSNVLNSKIDRVHHELIKSVIMSSDYENGHTHICWSASTLSNFELASVDYITKQIMKSKTSTCSRDPFPTVLVKCCIHSVSSIITAMDGLIERTRPDRR